MKTFKNFLRKIDIFGVPFNFKYKASDRYSTPFGGLIFFIFSILALAFGIYYFIPFISRKNLNIIYYTMNIPKTESIKLKDSQAAFSVGFDCEETDDFKVDDVFILESKYVKYIKNKEGNYDKQKSSLSSHNCNYQDFYNNYNESFDYLHLNKHQCLDNNDQIIEGIFSDQIFSYYEFSVIAKSKTEYIDKFLKNSDCKLQLYYTDITIDLYDYKEPIKPFLNSLFIQLNPTLYIKRNVYFMNQYLYDDDEILAVFNEEQKPKQMKTLFSRYEEYSLYLGLDREKTQPTDLEDYAKIYVRADTKKTDIRRTYQKLTEFYADASALLIALYDFLDIIISFINNFYAEQSVIKRLFIFKEMDDKYFRFSQKVTKIQELVTLTNENIVLERHERPKKHIRTSRKFMTMKSNSRNNLRNDLKKTTTNESDKNNVEALKQKITVFSFNIFEIIAILFFPCCLRGSLKSKNILSENARNILYNKLNIILYVRNMILIDIINNTLLDDEKKNIINFLSRPILSLNKAIEDKKDVFYESYLENDFDKFYKSFLDLVNKPGKEEREKRLVFVSKQKLKELV